MDKDLYKMDNFNMHLGNNNIKCQPLSSHNPHRDQFGTLSYLHSQMHKLIDVIQPSSGMSANVDFRKDNIIPTPLGPPPTHLDPIKVFTGETVDTIWKLRSEIPYLTKMEISDYRNSFYQNLCLCMISQGYHRAFTEIFELVTRQEEQRQAAGPDSILWTLSPISMQEDKLTLMKDCLCKAEDYFRVDDYKGMLESYSSLANYFKDYPEDKWLVDHFLKYSLDVSKQIDDGDNIKYAVANYELGLAMEQNKEYDEAFTYFHQLYTLSKGFDWKNKDRKLLFHEACEHLARICLAMADKPVAHEKQGITSDKISYIREAYDYSKESTNKKLEAECAYKLGMIYYKNSKAEEAISHLIQFYMLSKEIFDTELICQSCEALALVYREQEKYNECIKYLEEFVNISESNGLKELFSRACRSLGDVFNHLGEFNKATSYFSRSFGISRSEKSGLSVSEILRQDAVINEARVLFGVSRGNNINMTYTEHLYVSNKLAINRLINWKKDNKTETSSIDKPIPDKPTNTFRDRIPQRKLFDSIKTYQKL